MTYSLIASSRHFVRDSISISTFSVQLEVLNTLESNDRSGKYHCVRLKEWFDYRGHVCMVFEKLGLSPPPPSASHLLTVREAGASPRFVRSTATAESPISGTALSGKKPISGRFSVRSESFHMQKCASFAQIIL
jgi:hypothetical protein